MPRFVYKVRDTQNRILVGNADAATVDEVLDRLAEKDLVPVSIDELNFDGTKKNQSFLEKLNEAFLRHQNKVPFKAVVFFTRQLATMVEAGVPLAQALSQLGEGERPVFKKIIKQVADDISMGSTFSDAISRHGGAFNNMYVSIVRSGEVAGALDEVLDQIATYMENVEIMRQKVKGAMRYPMFIGGFVTLMIIGILWKLVPTFESMYGSFNAKLPLPTQILINMSQVVRNNFFAVTGSMVFIVVGFSLLMHVESFKALVHRYILYVPVFGLILKKNIWATFCRTMALLMHSGTPILQATEIAGAVVGNKVYAASLEDVYKKLKTGLLLSQSLKETGLYPILVTQLVSTGEESGKVDELLRKAAEFYEREIKVTVDSLASIIEPFLIIILGGVVGGILIALYMPIFMIGKFITGA